MAGRAKRTKHRGQQTDAVLGGLTRELGINVTGDDLLYVLTTLMQVADDPDGIVKKAPFYRKLLQRMLPDTEFTRRRLARLLQGAEELSKACRVLLTLNDLDLFGEVKNATIDALVEVERSQDPKAGAPGSIVNKKLESRIQKVGKRLFEHPDPRVRNALAILSKIDEILDLSKPLPQLPSLEVIRVADLSLASKSHSRRRVQVRRP